MELLCDINIGDKVNIEGVSVDLAIFINSNPEHIIFSVYNIQSDSYTNFGSVKNHIFPARSKNIFVASIYHH
jgi:hypothetical protein